MFSWALLLSCCTMIGACDNESRVLSWQVEACGKACSGRPKMITAATCECVSDPIDGGAR